MNTVRSLGWSWLLTLWSLGALGGQPTFPRLPEPPLPPPWLQAWRFDDPEWLQDAELAPLSLEGVEWVPSWSGYALHITGRGPAVCLLPLEPGLSGQIPGSLRVWFAPDWSSQAAGGTGPRLPATLWQAGDNGWRVSTDAAGNTLQVLAVGALPWIELLSTPISWTAGQWHQLALTWAPEESTVMWLDGVAVAMGPELPAAVNDRLWLGGDPTGLLLARGTFDELYTFDQRLEAEEIVVDYSAYAPQAALGAVSLAEWHQLQEQIREKVKQARKDRRHPPPPEPFDPGCGLWLAITDVDETHLLLTLYNTLAGKLYRLETSPSYVDPDWVFFRNVTGNGGTVTEEVDTGGQEMGFFRVAYEPEPMFGFEGMDFAETNMDPPDIAAAVGPNHIVQTLNSKMAIFNRVGISQGPPVNLTNLFGSTDAVDPRVLYDHRRDRWVASSLERTFLGNPDFPFRKVNVAVSMGATPSYSPSDWWRYALTFNKRYADFDTLGMDANGIYLTVVFDEGKREHAVMALPKDSLYDGSYQPPESPLNEWLPVVPPELTANIIQPAVNFDDTPPDGPAWFLAKGVPELGPPYRGGAIYFRRLVWNGQTAQWSDAAWAPVGDGAGYRNYFDLDDSSVHAPQPGFDGVLDIELGRIGSRLSQVFIRDGVLWVAQQVGLSGTRGGYTGDSSGTQVDRSAAQWLKLTNNASGMGAALSVAEFGRVFDPAPSDPVWFQFPSMAAMASEDAVMGFSGSGKTTYLSSFAGWKPRLSSQFEYIAVLQTATNASFLSSGADYSTTCVDPREDNVIWTFQQYAKPPDSFGTYATQIYCFR